jgi:hypothetical protein
MGFETINTLGPPAMPEALVQPRRRGLQLHARPQTVRGAGAPPDQAVNLFLDVDQRCFHGASISRRSAPRKLPEKLKLRFSMRRGILPEMKTGQMVCIRSVIFSRETRANLVVMIEAKFSPADAAELRPGQPVDVILK